MAIICGEFSHNVNNRKMSYYLIRACAHVNIMMTQPLTYNSLGRDVRKVRQFIFKIIAVGDGTTGKTSIIRRYVHEEFNAKYIKTIGAQFSIYDKEINKDKIRLLFWDIAGQDNFNFARPSFFKNSRAAIIVTSLEENDLGKESFNNISKWYSTWFLDDIFWCIFPRSHFRFSIRGSCVHVCNL